MLGQARAQFGKAELDVARFTPLARDKAVSQEELDDAVRIVRQYAEYVQVKAVLGEDVEIGPYCTIGAKVKLGGGVRLHSHVVIDGETEIDHPAAARHHS